MEIILKQYSNGNQSLPRGLLALTLVLSEQKDQVKVQAFFVSELYSVDT